MREKLSRVSRRSPCAVCGHSDKACLFRPDGSAVLCSQRVSDRPSRGGCIQAWWHFFDEGATPKPAPKVESAKPEAYRASVEHIDEVLTTLLRGRLTLSPVHHQALEARGLTFKEIDAQGYASTPDEGRGDRIAASLAEFDLRGVPGFWRDGQHWRMKRCPPGFLIPVRNERSQIIGLQVRLLPQLGDTKYIWLSSANMRDGAGSGAPVHFAKPHVLPNANEIIVTEGSLKANVIAHFTGSPVVAAAGVGNFGADFAARLFTLCPHVTPIIAFDTDWMIKPQVAAALEKIKRELKAVGFKIKIRSWPSTYKGLDDFLLACERSETERRAA